ncbi:MAG: ribulose-phosphate 3-epimerase, partial [Oscillospiraceae bacterium]|nr:ribulose-phosphate 3-epimerase [Oscillospiraceae bacterium]
MIKLSPSILSADFVNLERDVRALGPQGADYVHVDVMDGLFVPNITIGIPVTAAIKKISPLPLDVHLMIDRPIRYVEDFCKAGADILTLHAEADSTENTLAALKRIRELGVRPAISVKPKTPAEAVLPFLEICSLILVMTVEPGFG